MATLHSIVASFDPQQTTTFSIPSNTKIDAEGFLVWVHMRQEVVQYITTLEIAGDALADLYAVVIANHEQCHWNDVVRLIHQMIHLETLEIPCGLSSAGVFSVMLEDLLQLMTPSMLNFKRFYASRRVCFGFLSQEGRQLLEISLPSSLEEFIVTDVNFRGPTRNEQPSIMADAFGGVLSQLTGLKRLEIQQQAYWDDRPSVLSISNLQVIFRCRSLKQVVLRNMAFTDDELEFIADELIRNCTLETIDLSGWNQIRSTRGYESFFRAMEYQFYVKEFKLFISDWRYTELYEVPELMVQQWELMAKGIDSFTKLNTADRRRILRDDKATRDDLFQLVELVQHDTNATFTIMRSHPQVICSAKSS